MVARFLESGLNAFEFRRLFCIDMRNGCVKEGFGFTSRFKI